MQFDCLTPKNSQIFSEYSPLYLLCSHFRFLLECHCFNFWLKGILSKSVYRCCGVLLYINSCMKLFVAPGGDV